MQTIQIDVKDIYIDNIKLYSTKDKAYQEEKAIFEATLKDYKQNGSKNFSRVDQNYWNDVRSRLIKRHQKAE